MLENAANQREYRPVSGYETFETAGVSVTFSAGGNCGKVEQNWGKELNFLNYSKLVVIEHFSSTYRWLNQADKVILEAFHLATDLFYRPCTQNMILNENTTQR